jgi:hypothetical protein
MTPITDKEMFAAATQRHITYLLIYGLLLLVVGLVICAYLPYTVNAQILSLATPLITGLYGLASGAVGFWIAKQRSQSAPDPSTTSVTTHIETKPSPMVVPVGTELVPAPQPPAAIITPVPPSPETSNAIQNPPSVPPAGAT